MGILGEAAKIRYSSMSEPVTAHNSEERATEGAIQGPTTLVF
jgi:hypothetical protein